MLTSDPADREEPPLHRQAIEASGLFDPRFYRSAYAEEIEPQGDALDHFLSTGVAEGLKPNARFDPLVYRLRHPDATEKGLLSHWLDRLRRGEGIDEDLTAKSAIPDPGDIHKLQGPTQELLDRDQRERDARPEHLGRASSVHFDLDGRRRELLFPSPEEIFGRLRDDRPFALPRLPHGFWDGLLFLRNARAAVERSAPDGLLSSRQLDRLATRLCDELLPGMGIYSENFLPELQRGIQTEKPHPDFLRSVSFSGAPTVDDRTFWRTEAQGPDEDFQLRKMLDLFGADGQLYEAMVWKRWAYSGDLKVLPKLARDRPVVLVGNDRLADLDARWRLPWFIHTRIPLDSYKIRFDVLTRCKVDITKANELARVNRTKRPLVILQGGSFAYWLIARLFQWEPGVFYLDLGQALNIWFLDHPAHAKPWLRSNPRLVLARCELEEFYRELGIELGPPFSGEPR